MRISVYKIPVLLLITTLQWPAFGSSENIISDDDSYLPQSFLGGQLEREETQGTSAPLVTIKSLQYKIHKHIKRVGGYWTPLSTLARVSEELGEICQIAHSSESAEELALEVADLFVITTCLANQYSCNLSVEYNKTGIPRVLNNLHDSGWTSPLGSNIYVMAHLIGELARVVNSYDGEKKPKMGAQLPTIQELTAKLHSVILTYAIVNKLDIIEHINSTLATSALRDKDRFDRLYDPTMCEALEKFNIIRNQIECPYAKLAKIWGSPDWKMQESFTNNLKNIMPVLNRFTKIAPSENLDGFVIAAPKKYGNALDTLIKFTRKSLQFFSEADPKGEHCMNKKIDDPTWQFSYNGLRLFIITFAPLYLKIHSRYAWDTDMVFLLLQPESSFVSHEIARGEELSRRNKIRKAFAERGREYYRSDIMDSNLEALKYIKPLNSNDSPIYWWEEGNNLDNQNSNNCILY
ncbi:MAG: YqcI/YcgG family protein [Alphaproteobacteria bacterium]|nr:YqcI/YcgG family protein [Alphaproteobacteria bacterium]